MSAGGVFTLIANEGRTDRLLLATALLNQRIHDIQCARRKAGKMDCWPTLVDIERTHVLFMNAHYKPFVAIGYEYNKVKVQNGVPHFNTQVVFSIPQFGDFFYDIVCRVAFSGWGTHADLTPAQGTGATTGTSSTGNKWDNTANYVSWTHNAFPYGLPVTDVGDSGASLATATNKTGQANFYRLVRYDGGVLVNGGVGDTEVATGMGSSLEDSACKPRSFNNLVRWIEYPANRFFKKVWFNVNNNPLDEYNDVCNIMYQKFCVPPNKEVGYNRMAGQEVPHDGWSGIKNVKLLQSDQGAGSSTNWLTPSSKDEPNPRNYTYHPSAIPENQLGDPWCENGQAVSDADKLKEYIRYDTPEGVNKAPAEYNTEALGYLPEGDPLIARYLYKVVDGPQTPKEWQPPLEIMHRLNFWFNEDVRLAVPSVAIPYGQRFIHMEIAPVEDLAIQEPGLFVEHVNTSIGMFKLANKVGTLTVGEALTADAQHYAYGPSVGAATVNAVARSVSTFYPYLHHLPNDNLCITNMELYINNIFVNPEIHDIYIRRIGFTLIRVHRYGSISVNEEGQNEKLISQLKWPIEYIFVGMRPKWNVSRSNRWMWRDWHRLSKVDTAVFADEGDCVDAFSVYGPKSNITNASWGNTAYVNTPDPAVVGNTTAYNQTANSVGKVAQHAYRLVKHAVQRTEYTYEQASLTSLTVTAHGITLYDYFNTAFYNSYIPYQYGGYNIRTPDDPGALMITFCLFPKTYQPSGHLNVSRAREFYIGWNSCYISSTHPAELVFCASAINFLLNSTLELKWGAKASCHPSLGNLGWKNSWTPSSCALEALGDSQMLVSNSTIISVEY